MSENVQAGRRQSILKRLVGIGKLRYFHTWKFPYNLTRMSWIVTVRDFCYVPRTILHCLCVQSESERAFESQVEETHCLFSRWISSMIQKMTWFFGFRAEDIVLREAVADLDSTLMKFTVSMHRTGVIDSNGKLGWRYRDQNGWSRRTRPINNRFTGRICRKNENKHRFGCSRW